MGIIKTLSSIVNKQLYEGVQGTIIPRGLAYPLDVYTKGTIRFGRKVGFVLPILVPDNRFTLYEDAVYQVDRIVVDREMQWIIPGGFISIGERELHRVDDVVDDTIILTSRLLADHPEGQYVYHYSNPIDVEGAYSKGQTIINIDSASWWIVRGDVLAISTNPALSLAFNEFVIEDLSLTGISPTGVYQYQVTLDKPIQRDLVDGEEIQLRAYCAYKSTILNVPTHGSPVRKIVGPFLLDWASAPFANDVTFGETQTIQQYTPNRNPIGPPLKIEKNTLMLNVPIRSDQFMFWDKVDGSINYDNGEHRFVIIPNSSGSWRLKYTCVPEIEVPSYFATGSISVVDPSKLNNNEQVVIGDSIDQKIFEFQIDGTYVPTPESVATGSITIGDSPSDNEWFYLDDGFGHTFFFEYERTGAYVPTTGYVTVDVTASALITDVVIATLESINDILSLYISASNSSPNVDLTHSKISTRDNQTIQLHPQLVIDGWSTTSMTGGTDEVITIDLTTKTFALEVAQLLVAAINTSGLETKADFPTTFPAFWVRALIAGSAPNILITETVVDPGFIVTGMAGGGGGAQWNFDLEPQQDGLFRIRLYPNDWQDYNLTSGIAKTIVVTLQPTDQPVERIDMLFSGKTADEVWMTDWSISGPRIGAIQYDYVMRVIGEHNFGSSSLWAKQLFQSLDDVKLQLDIGDAYDHGHLKL